MRKKNLFDFDRTMMNVKIFYLVCFFFLSSSLCFVETRLIVDQDRRQIESWHSPLGREKNDSCRKCGIYILNLTIVYIFIVYAHLDELPAFNAM